MMAASAATKAETTVAKKQQVSAMAKVQAATGDNTQGNKQADGRDAQPNSKPDRTKAKNGPRFGTAGLSASYAAAGNKNSLNAAAYTASFGLDAFEYQAGRGVRLAAATAAVLTQTGAAYGIQYSIHAPYYISMASMEEDKRLASLRYLRESAAAVRMLGGQRVVFHPGSCGKQSREDAMAKALDTLARAQKMLDDEGYDEIILCPETMGKLGQLGSLEEVLALCGVDARITPCVDFGHLNARTQGAIRTQRDYAEILDAMEAALGDERAHRFHVHFSKIEYTAGGEKRHLTLEDETFGPPYEPLLQLCAQRGLSPVIICESDGVQAEDARTMREYYLSLL